VHKEDNRCIGDSIRCTQGITSDEQEISLGAQEMASDAQEIASGAQTR